MAVPEISADEVVERLVGDVSRVLGDELVCVAGFGSWAAGDFCPGRSDVDLLAVLRRPPDESDLAALLGVHSRLEVDQPEWAGHVEVEYVATSSLRAIAAGELPDEPMLRISPGEALHLMPVTRHPVLDWDAAQRADRCLVGDPVGSVLPAFPEELVDLVLRDHLRQWPQWVTESEHVGFRAYAVLTVARCVVRLRSGEPVSKRAGARELARLEPRWAPLLAWAEHWWYEGGSDHDPAPPDVVAFVRETMGACR